MIARSVYTALMIASIAIMANCRSLQASELPQEKACYKRLVRAMTYLLVSDYNRMTTSSNRLYIKVIGPPEIACQSGDMSECTISLQLTPSRCERTTTSPFGYCKPLHSTNEGAKDCVGLVDFTTALIRVPLQCRQSGYETIQANSDETYFSPLDVQSDLGNDDLFSFDSVMPPKATFNKKWDGQEDGNPHPF